MSIQNLVNKLGVRQWLTVMAVLVALTLALVLYVAPDVRQALKSWALSEYEREAQEFKAELQDIGNWWMQSAAGLLTMGISYLLFRIRQKWLLYYGMAEVGVAALVAFHTTTTLREALAARGDTPLDEDAPSMLAILSLAGALYLAIRGYNNVSEALKLEAAEKE
jgi:hypothetical protein